MIQPKYEIGQRMYHIIEERYDWQEKECYICEGTTMADIKGEKFSCPKCNGYGVLNICKKRYVIKGEVINGYDVRKINDDIEIVYHIGHYGIEEKRINSSGGYFFTSKGRAKTALEKLEFHAAIDTSSSQNY